MGKITLKSVRKSFGDVDVIPSIDLGIEDGEFVVFVGPSGCGKSTLLRLIAGLEDTTSGTIEIDGADATSLPPAKRGLAMVFQSYALYPHMSVRKNIAFPLKMAGIDPAVIEQKVNNAAKVLNLTSYLDRRPGQLSGGQRQRVNIARALAFHPRLVILDEAVAALDKSVQAQVLNLLQELKAERQLTYLFISHDLHVVHYISDEVMVMYLGQVVERGPVEKIYSEAAHPYTRALLSAVPSMDPSQRTQKSPLSGDPPNPINPPSGCRFRDRCTFAQAVCASSTPVLMSVKGDVEHIVACHMNDAQSGHSGEGVQA